MILMSICTSLLQKLVILLGRRYLMYFLFSFWFQTFLCALLFLFSSYFYLYLNLFLNFCTDFFLGIIDYYSSSSLLLYSLYSPEMCFLFHIYLLFSFYHICYVLLAPISVLIEESSRKLNDENSCFFFSFIIE